MIITLKQLKDLKACEDGIVWFKKQKNKEAKSILRTCIKEQHFAYANWFITKLFTKPQAVTYAIFNAEQCISKFEKEYPNDKRPRQAIEAAKRWLESPTEENRSAVWSATEYVARSATWSATAESARSARSAAEAAGYAAIEKAIEILEL
jgi:hypothetical protein